MNMLKKMKYNSLLKQVNKLYDKRDAGANVDVKHEIKALIELAKFLEEHQFDKTMPNALKSATEYYRAAANLGSVDAQYHFGLKKLEEGKFWQQCSNERYARDIHETYAKNCYEEAFNYFQTAEESDHILATRMHGLAYIKGWGLPVDEEKGLKLIVKSIEKEGSWEQAKDIIEKLGLDPNQFFSAIMAFKQKQ